MSQNMIDAMALDFLRETGCYREAARLMGVTVRTLRARVKRASYAEVGA